MGQQDQISAVDEAVKKEQQLRSFAYTGLPVHVCGIPLRLMTWRDFLMLDGVDNAFVCGGVPSLESVVEFMWTLSPHNKQDLEGWRRKWAIRKFAKSIRKIDAESAMVAIFSYVEETFFDRPASGGKEGIPYYSWLTCTIDLLASEYGWTDEYIVTRPIRLTNQLVRAIQRRLDSKTVLSNHYSDKAWLELSKAMNS